jgi:hypothetical protein
LLAIQQQTERARLEEAINAGDIADAAGERAKLERRQAADQRRLDQDQEGPGARYLRDLRDEASSLADSYEEIAVNGLGQIEDALAGTVTKALGLHGVLGDIVGDFIQLAIRMAVIEPLARQLFGGGGSSGGGIGGLLGSIVSAGASIFGGGSSGSSAGLSGRELFGRASGGPVAPGQFYRVNENATPGRVEGFMSRDGGQIIPLGKMDAIRGSGGGAGGEIFVRVTLTDDLNARIDNRAAGVAVQVTREAAPTIIDAATQNTLATAGRRRL